jgi:hypothetical protein
VVGKLNLPPDADERDDVMGASMPTPGLTAVDQEREASMADEGGTAGAVMECEEPPAAEETPAAAPAKPPTSPRD